MSADDIDHRGLPTDEQVTGTVRRQAALLLRRLSRDESHVRPSDRSADRLGVGRIVLLPFSPTRRGILYTLLGPVSSQLRPD